MFCISDADKRGVLVGTEIVEVPSVTIDKLYEDKYVALSNALLQAREKASLLESKIELLAIYRMNDGLQTTTKMDAKNRPYDVHFVEISRVDRP